MPTTIISAEQAHAFDAYTIDQLGVPSMVLMERAALAITDRLLTGTNFDLNRVLVVAATGNNGGDGVAVARLLHLKHVPVTIWLLGNRDRASEQTAQQLAIAERYGVTVTDQQPDLDHFTTIVDAIFGVGLARHVTGTFATAVNQMNASPANIMAVDMPTGLGTDDGQVMGTAIEATETVTMGYNKLGLCTTVAQQYAGVVTVADIGIYDPTTLH
ncbi:NAD(P)H-hydrate epimerase [Furfurilactobacillus entadae]|uniref:NAD(P)H-hydrate epimerase n=1 Tax=Furfurilactobacillus entadae TaxID=2922307 RepID=UPI0035EF911E